MTSSKKPQLPHNVQAAVENMVGLKEGEKRWGHFAERLGVSEAILRHKVARATEDADKRHHLTLAEAIEMAKASGDNTLIHTICNELDGEFLHYPGIDATSDSELLSRYTSMMKELGQFSNDIHLSLADGKITPNEITQLRKDFLRLSAALSEMMDRLQEQANRDQKTAQDRGA